MLLFRVGPLEEEGDQDPKECKARAVRRSLGTGCVLAFWPTYPAKWAMPIGNSRYLCLADWLGGGPCNAKCKPCGCNVTDVFADGHEFGQGLAGFPVPLNAPKDSGQSGFVVQRLLAEGIEPTTMLSWAWESTAWPHYHGQVRGMEPER